MFALVFWYSAQALNALTPLVIGAGVVVVAWRQWRTAQAKVRLELFDRRFAVYLAARDLLNDLIGTGDCSPEVLERLRCKLAEARFLFLCDIWKFTDDLWIKAFRLDGIKKARAVQGDISKEGLAMPGTPQASIDAARAKLKPLYDDENKLHDWFKQEFANLASRFNKYLNLGDLK